MVNAGCSPWQVPFRPISFLLSLALALALPLSMNGQTLQWDHFYEDGAAWLKATGSGVPSVAMTIQLESGYLVVGLRVVNDTEANIDIVPEKVQLALQGKTPKFLPLVYPEQIIAKINGRAQLSIFLSQFGAARLGTEEAQRQAGENQRQTAQQAADAANLISSTAIRANTIRPSQQLQGFLYFKGDRSCGSRKGCALKLNVLVGETQYPITWTFGDAKVTVEDPPKVAPAASPKSPSSRPPTLLRSNEVPRPIELKEGAPLPESGVLYLTLGTKVIKLESTVAQYTTTADDEVFVVVPGEASPTSTTLKRPVIVSEGQTVPEGAFVLELYRMEAKSGNRRLLYRVGNRIVASKIPIEMTALSRHLYQVEVSEDLTPGQYCLTPNGSDEMFLFEIR